MGRHTRDYPGLRIVRALAWSVVVFEVLFIIYAEGLAL